MVQDELAKETNNNKIIEILIQDGEVKLWLPVIATDLRLMNKDYELVRVIGTRVRNLKKRMRRLKHRQCPNCHKVILKRFKVCPECKFRVYGPSISDPERAKKISQMLDSGDYTLQAVGNIFGKSRERIRQIYKQETGYAYGSKFAKKQKTIKKQLEKERLEKINFYCKACKKPVTKKNGKYLHKFCAECRAIQKKFDDPTTTAICLNCGNSFHPARNWRRLESSCLFDSFKCFQEFLRKNNIWTNNFRWFMKENNLKRIIISGRN